MTPTPEKTATLNFRVSEHVSEMLRQLAEDAGLSLTEYVTTFIRAQYKRTFPEKASAYETAAERFERQIITGQPRETQDQRGRGRKGGK